MRDGKVMRRRAQFAALLAAAVGVSLATGGTPNAHAALKPGTARTVHVPTATPIQHVVVIMQENRSFDQYFGTYPGANGTCGSACSQPPSAGANCNPDPVT